MKKRGSYLLGPYVVLEPADTDRRSSSQAVAPIHLNGAHVGSIKVFWADWDLIKEHLEEMK